jgi:hypothetical protein
MEPVNNHPVVSTNNISPEKVTRKEGEKEKKKKKAT